MKFISTKIRVIILVVALCLVTAIVCFLRSPYYAYYTGPGQGPNGEYTDQQLAIQIEGTGEMTRQEFLRQIALETLVQKTGQISDADLDWVLHMAQTPGIGDTKMTPTRHLNALLTLKHLRTLMPGQKEKIYLVAVPYLTSADKSEKIGAMAAIQAIKDKRTVPAVAKLLNDQDPLVREMAQKTLTVLNS